MASSAWRGVAASLDCPATASHCRLLLLRAGRERVKKRTAAFCAGRKNIHCTRGPIDPTLVWLFIYLFIFQTLFLLEGKEEGLLLFIYVLILTLSHIPVSRNAHILAKAASHQPHLMQAQKFYISTALLFGIVKPHSLSHA